MDQFKNTTIRFGITPDAKDFRDTGTPGDWHRWDITFSSPFGAPIPGLPKGVPQQISVVATPFEADAAPVAVIKNVTNTGFVLWARNAWQKKGSARFAWLAVLGVPDSHEQRRIETRFGVLQTKVLEPPQNLTEWPGIWYSDPMATASPDAAPAVLLTEHNISGPCRGDIVWNNPASVAISVLQRSAPFPVLPSEGFAAAAVNVDTTDGRAGYYYASFVDAARFSTASPSDLWLDHGSDKGVEDGFRFNTPPSLFTAPNRAMKPGGIPGDWVHLDVYFSKPFLTPPIVLATARDTTADPSRPLNPLVAIAQNVTTHGFTMALRNTDSRDATAEFFWIAIGCQAGCA
jgi:hypothetical protein